jgi:hypothetical protein
MKQKSESETDLNVGDRVRLKPQTLAWRAEMTLQEQIGEVVGCRDDGRVTIRFDGGKLLMGRDVNSFERVREPAGMTGSEENSVLRAPPNHGVRDAFGGNGK